MITIKTVDEIVNDICHLFNVKRFDIFSSKRHWHIVEARTIIIHILYFHPIYAMRLTQLARLFEKDHTSILYCLRRCENANPHDMVLYRKLELAHMYVFEHIHYLKENNPKLSRNKKGDLLEQA